MRNERMHLVRLTLLA